MPKEVGGGPKIAGDDKREVVKFHEELSEDRVHSLRDLKAVLEPFENKADFQRQNLPNKDLEEYLTHEENKHWGNPRYEFSTAVDPDVGIPDVEGYVSFQYSPWLNEEKDVLIQGRAGFSAIEDLDEPIPVDWGPEEEKYPRKPRYTEILNEGKDLYWISIPTDPEKPLDFPFDFVGIMRHTAKLIDKYD